jgi:hypothetical protein
MPDARCPFGARCPMQYRNSHMTSRRSIFAITLTVVILGVVIGAFFLVGSPEKGREQRFDDQRSQNLQTIRYQGVDEFVRRTENLPASLEEIQKTIVINAVPDPFIDPETGAPVEYEKTGDASYALCATFDLPSDAATSPNGDVFWTHGAGRTCFKLQIQSTGPTSKSSVPVP